MAACLCGVLQNIRHIGRCPSQNAHHKRRHHYNQDMWYIVGYSVLLHCGQQQDNTIAYMLHYRTCPIVACPKVNICINTSGVLSYQLKFFNKIRQAVMKARHCEGMFAWPKRFDDDFVEFGQYQRDFCIRPKGWCGFRLFFCWAIRLYGLHTKCI